MAMSIGGIGSAYGMSYIQPMNYTLKNESDISEDFAKKGAAGLVTNVSPVGYPNAQAIAGDDEEKENPLAISIGSVMKSQEANKMYNEVAQKFQGMTVGYSQNMAAQAYATQGSTLDLFA
jgi:hypothetical protein